MAHLIHLEDTSTPPAIQCCEGQTTASIVSVHPLSSDSPQNF